MNRPSHRPLPLFLATLLAMAASLPAAAQDSSTLDDGLIGAWNLNETTAGTALDSTTGANHGAHGSGVAVSTSIPPVQFANPRSLSFNNTAAGSVSVPSATFGFTSNTFTISFWANPAKLRTSTIQQTTGSQGTNGQSYAIFPLNGELNFGGTTHTGLGVSVGTNGISVFEHRNNHLPSLLVSDMTISGWTHITVVVTAKSPALYVGGVFVKTGLTSTITSLHPSPAMGGLPGGTGSTYGPYQGLLDDVRIYNRALSVAEIATLGAGYNGVDDFPFLPTTLKQFDPSTGLEIAQGTGMVLQPEVEAQATASTPMGGQVQLEIEVKPLATPFTGIGNGVGPLIASGGTASVVSTGGLIINSDYHWQVRTLHANGMASGWVPMGTVVDKDFATRVLNTNPTISALDQIHVATGLSIPPGTGVVDGNTIRFRAMVTDADDPIRVELEIRPTGSTFTQNATSVSDPVGTGTTVSEDVLLEAGAISWKARAVDGWGAASAWTSFGLNSDLTDPDVIILDAGSEGNPGFDCAGSAGPGGAAAGIVLTAILVLGWRRI